MTSNNDLALSSVICPAFYRVHKAIKTRLLSEVWLKGGRGSTKSSFIAIEIIQGMMRDPEANAIVFRKVGDTIRGSVHALLLWAISKLGVEKYWDATTSPAEITYLPTKQKIFFRGLDKPTKIKSIALTKGQWRFSWFEETEEYNNMEEIRNVMQSVARGTDEHTTFFSFNPPNDPASWVNLETRLPDGVSDNPYQIGTRLIHHSDYRDVPAEWLGTKFIEKAEQLKENDREAYDHEYLGLAVGKSERIVFSGKWREGVLDTAGMDGPYYAMDFGFSNDPNVVGCQWVDWDNNILYVEYAEYGYRTEINDLPTLIRRIPGLCEDYETDKLKDGAVVTRKDADGNPIYKVCKAAIRADSARPETISYLKNHGFSGCTGVKKWKNSDKDGVEFMRGFKEIVFHPRCTEAMDEARYYSYKTNKAGDILNDLEDSWNHWVDQCRYALAPLIKDRDTGEEVIVSTTTGGSIGEIVM